MDPLFLNYMQQQSQNQEGNRAPAAPQQGPYNPFDVGVNKAIESARKSFEMTSKQQDRAIRSGMLTFGQNLSEQPREKGFFKNFAAVGKALSPAVIAYDQNEAAAENENNALAKQILDYQAQERERQALEEERVWRRQSAESQLSEQQRYHNMLNDRHKQQNVPGVSNALGSEFIPIESKAERSEYVKDKKAAGEILHELSSIKKDYDDFKILSQNDLINPMTPYGVGSAANATKDFFGYFLKNKELKKETSKRKALDAKLGKFALELERKIKGGILSEGMVKRFEKKGLLPSLGDDTQENFEEKLNDLVKDMGERHKAAVASLRYGVHLSPYDLEKLEKQSHAENNLMKEMPTQDNILMQDANGEQYMIPVNEVDEAINDGFKIVGQ